LLQSHGNFKIQWIVYGGKVYSIESTFPRNPTLYTNVYNFIMFPIKVI